jgi:beta-glucanase (GH16 family)
MLQGTSGGLREHAAIRGSYRRGTLPRRTNGGAATVRRQKLAIGIPAMALAVIAGLGLSGGLTPGAQASAATAAARAIPKPPSGKPAFNAGFGGHSLNTKDWDTCYPLDSQKGCTNFGNPMEAEWYLPSQVKVSGGVVHLVAQRKRTEGTTKTGAPKRYECRSGMITSYPGFKFEYGFVQVVAKIPHANGLWPALWLSAANGHYPPEIDMVESWGVNAETASFFHPVTGNRSRAKYSPALTRGWQTYSLSWTRTRLRYYVGSRLVLTIKSNVPHQRMYFIANVAEYVPAKAGRCNSQMEIRSVKIWKS